MSRQNRNEVIEKGLLSGIDNFVIKRDDFIFNSFKRFQNRSDVLNSILDFIFNSFKRFQNRSDVLNIILDVLETIYLIFRKTIVQRVSSFECTMEVAIVLAA